MKTLEQALADGETVEIERREKVGVVAYRCGCGRWRPAHCLRDLRADDATPAAFVCDACEAALLQRGFL